MRAYCLPSASKARIIRSDSERLRPECIELAEPLVTSGFDAVARRGHACPVVKLASQGGTVGGTDLTRGDGRAVLLAVTEAASVVVASLVAVRATAVGSGLSWLRPTDKVYGRVVALRLGVSKVFALANWAFWRFSTKLVFQNSRKDETNVEKEILVTPIQTSRNHIESTIQQFVS